MTKIEIYTQMGCGYCARALRLLQSKNVAFEQIDVSLNSSLRAEMVKRTGGRNTSPQVFVDDEHIGDSDEIFALERAGHLDKLLKLGS
ncbi:glutaredoxin 3 [Alphaproteobacteria bacterium]|jgi:glutaredoxin 3|nr:glutaredoxin 3 [Alphaproteobacteria bacterium]